MGKAKMLKVRTCADAKETTLNTLCENGLSVSYAYNRLTSERGLVSRTDADFSRECAAVSAALRKMIARKPDITHTKPMLRAYRDHLLVARRHAMDTLALVIAEVGKGCQPIRVRCLVGRLDTFYTIRIDTDGMASVSGADYSHTVRRLLDGITEIPSRAGERHFAILRGLSDTVAHATDVLSTAMDGEAPAQPSTLTDLASALEQHTEALGQEFLGGGAAE